MMIENVLSTDMAIHFSQLETFKQRTSASDFDICNANNKKMTTNWLVHMSDLSNPTKPFHTYKKWVDLLFVEFFE